MRDVTCTPVTDRSKRSKANMSISGELPSRLGSGQTYHQKPTRLRRIPLLLLLNDEEPVKLVLPYLIGLKC